MVWLDKPLGEDIMVIEEPSDVQKATLGTDFEYGYKVYELDAATDMLVDRAPTESFR